MSVVSLERTYVTCAAVLYVKFLATTGIQAIKTFDAGGRPPEDKDLPLAKGRPTQTYGIDRQAPDEKVLKAREIEKRWRLIVLNDLESIPLALLVFGGGVMVRANEVVHTGALVTYTVVRCLHTYSYARGLQPHRAWCWRIGVVAILVGAGNALVKVYSS